MLSRSMKKLLVDNNGNFFLAFCVDGSSLYPARLFLDLFQFSFVNAIWTANISREEVSLPWGLHAKLINANAEVYVR